MALGGFSLEPPQPITLAPKTPAALPAWAPPTSGKQSRSNEEWDSALRSGELPSWCTDDFNTILARYPLAFRAGDDDLKSSVARIVDALAELAMQCPRASFVITVLSGSALTAARAKRLANALRSRGLDAAIDYATEASNGTLQLSIKAAEPVEN